MLLFTQKCKRACQDVRDHLAWTMDGAKFLMVVKQRPFPNSQHSTFMFVINEMCCRQRVLTHTCMTSVLRVQSASQAVSLFILVGQLCLFILNVKLSQFSWIYNMDVYAS